MLGRSSRLDRAAITINITAITITATVATATAVCFSNNGFGAVVVVAAVCESDFAPIFSWFVVDSVVVDVDVVGDDVVDNVVVSVIDVWTKDELSVVWLDPFVVAFSVVSLFDVVVGDTVVVVVVVVEVDDVVVVVDSVVEVAVGTCEDVDSTVIIVEDPVALVVTFGVGVIEVNVEVDVELPWQTSTRECKIRTHNNRRIVLKNHFGILIYTEIQTTPYPVEFFEYKILNT